MKVICRAIDPDGQFRGIAEAEALDSWRRGDGLFWVSLESADRKEAGAWLAGLGIDQEMMDALDTGDSTGRILPLESSVFFEYPLPASAEEFTTVMFGLLCLDRLVVTIDQQPMTSKKYGELISQLRLSEPSTSGLICALSTVHSQQLRRAALSLRDRVREASGLMDDDPAAIPLSGILALKRQLLDMDRITDEQMAVFDLLQVLDKPMVDMVALGSVFHTAVSNVQAADRRLERLDRSVVALQHRYESLQQDKINRRLAFLTIVSAIFMPLTLVVGIYGMNFDNMPELHFEDGYFFALGGMALVASGLLLFFWKKKWLD